MFNLPTDPKAKKWQQKKLRVVEFEDAGGQYLVEYLIRVSNAHCVVLEVST